MVRFQRKWLGAALVLRCMIACGDEDAGTTPESVTTAGQGGASGQGVGGGAGLSGKGGGGASGGGAAGASGKQSLLHLAQGPLRGAIDLHFGEGWKFRAGDVDGDGDLDLLSLGPSYVLVAHREGLGFTMPKSVAKNSAVEDAERLLLVDISGDGRADLLYTSRTDLFTFNPLTIALGTESGGFDFDALTDDGEPHDFAVGDLNGDGLQDIALLARKLGGSLGDSRVLVTLGQGQGVFPKPSEIWSGEQVSKLQLIDANKDGKLDVVAISAGLVRVHLGKGDGSFGGAVETAISIGPEDTASGDINGDGQKDLVFHYGDEPLLIYLGKGDGTFSLGSELTIPTPNPPNYSRLAVGDLDGDGKDDVVVVTEEDHLHISYGGTPSEPFITIPVGNTEPSSGVQILDLDGDGHMDIFLSGPGKAILVRGGPARAFFVPEVSDSPLENASVFVGNADGDGKLDLFLKTDQMYKQRGQASGGFSAPEAPFTHEGYAIFEVGDVNGDGISDFVSIGGNEFSLLVRLGSSDGSVAPPLSTPFGQEISFLALRDFDGDGKLDLAAKVSGEKGRLLLLRGNGDGVFAQPVPHGVDNMGLPCEPVDVDGDGRPDIVLGVGDGLGVLRGTADGFAFAGMIPGALRPLALAVGDLDGDGRQEVLAPSGEELWVLSGDASGIPVPTSKIDMALREATTGDLALADLDGDGRLDLAVLPFLVVAEGNTTAVLLGNGDKSFQPPTFYSLPRSAQSLRSGDINGDGKVDLVLFENPSSGAGPGLLTSLLGRNK